MSIATPEYKDWREQLEKNKKNGLPYITLSLEDFQRILDQAEQHSDCDKNRTNYG